MYTIFSIQTKDGMKCKKLLKIRFLREVYSCLNKSGFLGNGGLVPNILGCKPTK